MTRVQPAPLAVLAAAVLAACGAPVGPGSVASQLAVARARWEARGPSTYEMTLLRGCECLPEWSGPVAISVRDGAVESRQYANTGEPVDAGNAHLFPGVEGLFTFIENAMERAAGSIEVAYHPLYGYPLSVSVDYSPEYVDDEISYAITDFQPH